MLYKYLSIFPTLFYGISYYFTEILTEIAVGRKMSVVVTSFGNKLSARPPMLLKPESTTDILIDQDHKFQNSYFKEHL